ncbi:hypothetical protein P154DRAFT_521930 [Amniculicola lignicola CBS 123094]|uniref:BAH domain-containing protein n=1 Tax=Amniculicola lignicola CBS 123094 TaxID=1392246 RepID=A0A6A5WJU9_9PLEO|nr:hypothetical protein P154DRAFT_521930 [Amniculicola lignicola CBS 123094]
MAPAAAPQATATSRAAPSASTSAPPKTAGKRKASRSHDQAQPEASSPRFTIAPANPNAREKPSKKKRKVGTQSKAPPPYRWAKDLFDGGSLADVCYTVRPSLEAWESVKTYRQFTFEGQTFNIGECIYVQAAAEENADPNAPIPDWVGKVLEVRGEDMYNVFVRVVWFYRPEDLPGGRQPYHGENELIASNETAIIEAATVQGRVVVNHWVEQDNRSERLYDSDLFWRQTYDVTDKKRGLSKLPRHCVDDMPCNPDDGLVQCDSCLKWLHAHCLEAEAIRNAYKAQSIPYPEPEVNTNKKKQSAKASKGKGAAAKNLSSPELIYEAKLDFSNPEGDLTVLVRSKDQKKNMKKDPDSSISINVVCLLCKSPIKAVEPLETDVSEDEAPVEKVVTPQNPDLEDSSSAAAPSSKSSPGPGEDATLRQCDMQLPPEKPPATPSLLQRFTSAILSRSEPVEPVLNSEADVDADADVAGEKDKEGGKDSGATSKSTTPCPAI